MLLQTFVQLNILLMAAPALVGWVMSPVAHPALVQAAQVMFQPVVREAETAPAAVEEHLAPQLTVKAPAALRPLALAISSRDAATPALAVSAEPAITRFHPFPHAARAP